MEAASSSSPAAFDATVQRLEAEGFDLKLDADYLQNLDDQEYIGLMSMLKGYVGETLATGALTAKGHGVVLAETANQRRWDLKLGDVEHNVKVGKTAEDQIREHFQRYPDTPVITDPDTASDFDPDLAVALPDLDPDHVESVVQQGLDASGAGEGLDLGIPVFTLGMATWREIGTAVRYGGSVVESLRAIGEDVASVAVFGLTFGLIGLIAGGPCGAVLGKLIGAMIGRWVRKSWLGSDARSALAEFNERIKGFHRGWLAEYDAFKSQSSAVISRWNCEIERRTEPQRRSFYESVARAQAAWCRNVIELGAAMVEVISKLHVRLEAERAWIERSYPLRPWWKVLLWPSRNDYLRQMSLEWLDGTRSELNQWHERVARAVAEVEMTGVADNLPTVEDLDSTHVVPTVGERLLDKVTDLQRSIAEFTSSYHIEEASAGAAGRRVRERVDRITRWLNAQVDELRKQCMPVWTECRRHAQRELATNWEVVAGRLMARLEPYDDEWQAVARKCDRAGISLGRRPTDTYRAAFQSIARQLGAKPGVAEKHRLLPWSFLFGKRPAARTGVH